MPYGSDDEIQPPQGFTYPSAEEITAPQGFQYPESEEIDPPKGFSYQESATQFTKEPVSLGEKAREGLSSGIDFLKDQFANYGVGTGNMLSMLSYLFKIKEDETDAIMKFGLRTAGEKVDVTPDNDSSISKFLADLSENTSTYWEGKKSDHLNSIQAELDAKLENTEGIINKAGVGFWETIKSPELLTSFIAEQAPSLVVAMLAGRGAGMSASALGFSPKIAAELTTAGMVGTDATLSYADAGQSAYQQLTELPDDLWALNADFKKLVDSGTEPEKAKQQLAFQISRNSATAAGLTTLGLNKLPGATILERYISGVKLPAASTMLNAAKGFMGEAGQNAISEGAEQFYANIAERAINPEADLTKGVGEVAGQSAVFGLLGAGAGVRGTSKALKDKAKGVSDADNIDQAIDAAREEVEADLIKRKKGLAPDTTAPIIESEESSTESGRQAVRAAEEKLKAEAAAARQRQADIESERQTRLREQGAIVGEPEPLVEPSPTEQRPLPEATEDEILAAEPVPTPVEPVQETEEQRIQRIETEVRREEELKQEARAKIKAEQAAAEKAKPIEVPLSELKLSKDIPQFKAEADKQGIVEPLIGKFDRTGMGPIQVWVRKNGDKEIITGRHRFDLAKRSGETSIPAQLHYEADGFDAKQAKALDAILNIREGQGKVSGFVTFIQDSNITDKELESKGVTSREVGRKAIAIARNGTTTLIDVHKAGLVSDAGAVAIAKAAPNNEALQTLGIKELEKGRSITATENLVKAVQAVAPDAKVDAQGDLFGGDTTAIEQATNMAKIATRKQAEINRILSTVSGPTKNLKQAAKEGINVKDPKALSRRVTQLKNKKEAWKTWQTNPALIREIENEISQAKPQPAAEEGAEPVQEERTITEHTVDLKTLKTFKNTNDAAAWLRNNAKEPATREIAAAVEGLLGTDTKVILKQSGKRKSHTRRGSYVARKTSPNSPYYPLELHIYREGRNEQTIIHEIIHEATVNTITRPKTESQRKAISEIESLKRDVTSTIAKTSNDELKSLGLSKQELLTAKVPLTDTYEFVTYSLSNPHFQNVLRKLSPAKSTESFFKKLTQAIKDLLGIKAHDSFLARALDASYGVISSAKETEGVQTNYQDFVSRRNDIEGFTRDAKGYRDFRNEVKKEFDELKNKLPAGTVTNKKDFQNFMDAKMGKDVPLNEIKLTRKIRGTDGKLHAAQADAETVLRQSRKKRDNLIKLLGCLHG